MVLGLGHLGHRRAAVLLQVRRGAGEAAGEPGSVGVEGGTVIRTFDPQAPQGSRWGEVVAGPEIHTVASEVGLEADLHGAREAFSPVVTQSNRRDRRRPSGPSREDPENKPKAMHLIPSFLWRRPWVYAAGERSVSTLRTAELYWDLHQSTLQRGAQ